MHGLSPKVGDAVLLLPLAILLCCLLVLTTYSNEYPTSISYSPTSLNELLNRNHRLLKSDTKTSSSKPLTPLTPGDVSLCLIVKDDLDLEEWVEYHLALGVGRVYLFDNNSTRVPIIPMLHRFITSGKVVYRYLSDPLPFPRLPGDPPRIKNKQAYAYRQCIRNFKDKHEFMGFIDVDEFIVVKDPQARFLDILERYRNYGGLTLNWMVFGTSGHVTRPAGGVLQNYYRCHQHRLVKSIVNTRFVKDIGSDPHHFMYSSGYFAVDVNFTKVPLYANPQDGPIPQYLFDTIYINHYELKSREDYLLKMNRGRADLPDTPNPIERIDAIDSANTDACSFLSKPTVH